MANFVFNVAKGRVRELVARVDGNDPSNSALIIVPLSQSGSEAQGQDLDDLAAVEADSNFAERTTNGWARVAITDSALGAGDYDSNDTDNRGDASIPETSLGSPSADAVTGLLVCYDPDTTGGTDSGIIPLTHHDFAKTGDGSELRVAAGDFFRAS